MALTESSTWTVGELMAALAALSPTMEVKAWGCCSRHCQTNINEIGVIDGCAVVGDRDDNPENAGRV